MTPASYGRGGEGAVIAYAFADTALGRVIVGATATGICFVGIGDDAGALVSVLQGDYPKAELAADPAGLGGTVAEVAATPGVRKSGEEGKSVEVGVDIGGGR